MFYTDIFLYSLILQHLYNLSFSSLLISHFLLKKLFPLIPRHETFQYNM
jgi:hypothetical protein